MFRKVFVQQPGRIADQIFAGALFEESPASRRGNRAAVGVDAEQLPAKNRTVCLTKARGQLLNSPVVIGFCLGIGRPKPAVKQADRHEHTGDGSADLSEPAHAAAERGGERQRRLPRQTGLIAERRKYRLGAVVAFREKRLGGFRMRTYKNSFFLLKIRPKSKKLRDPFSNP